MADLTDPALRAAIVYMFQNCHQTGVLAIASATPRSQREPGRAAKRVVSHCPMAATSSRQTEWGIA